jgi:hypothetical protein
MTKSKGGSFKGQQGKATPGGNAPLGGRKPAPTVPRMAVRPRGASKGR